MQYRAHEIVYDTDGHDVDLPSELLLDLDDDVDPSLELADAISDETGFCVKSFQFEEAPAPSPGA